MYVREMPLSEIDGFNPLKAIGRALGSTGRAIVGAVIPGVGGAVKGVLDTAAKTPAAPAKEAYLRFNDARRAAGQPTVSEAEYNALMGGQGPVAQSTAAVQSAAAATPAGQSTTDQLLTAVLTKLQTPGQAQPAAVQPPPAPATPVVVTTSVPSGGGSGGGGSAAMPSWAIPAMIGGFGLLMVMMQNKSR